MSRAAFPPMPTAEHPISAPPDPTASSSGPTTRRRAVILGLELALLAAVFAISVALRSPNLDRPLSQQHEWLTAHSLIVMQIWWEDGAWDTKFTQRMNYPRQADKYINNAAMSLYGHYLPHDAKGNFYYMSHPSMAMVVPYALFRALGVRPDVKPLQIFGLAVHLLCALIVFALVRTVDPTGNSFNGGAVLSGAGYLLLPANLWYHSNVYYTEIFAQLPFLVVALLAIFCLRRLKRRGDIGTAWVLALAVASAVAVFTEWLGVLAAGAVAAYALWKALSSSSYLKIVAATALGGSFAMAVFVLQYASQIGLRPFITHLAGKFYFRAGLIEVPREFSGFDLGMIAEHFALGAGVIFILLILLLVCFKTTPVQILRGERGLIVYLLAAPALMHHLLLLHFTTEHDYSILKSTPFLVVTGGLLWNELQRRGGFLGWHRRSVFALSLLAFSWISVSGYRDYAYARFTRHYQHDGEIIAKTAKDDEVVFAMMRGEPRPQLLFYAGRNILKVGSVEQAKEWLRNGKSKATKGIVFVNYGDRKVVRFER